MVIEISGGDTMQQQLCQSLVKFVLPDICGPRLSRVLDLEITLVTGLYEQTGMMGSCMHIDEDGAPRIFEIEVDAELMPRWLLITLAHELVHVKQYAKQQLKQLIMTPEYNYNGVRYDPSDRKRFPCSSFLPWEIEARGLEEALFLKWANAQPVEYEWAHCEVFATAK